jgi:hypothetical protein
MGSYGTGTKHTMGRFILVPSRRGCVEREERNAIFNIAMPKVTVS